MAGCLLFLLFGGVMRVFAVKTFMEREQKRSLEQVLTKIYRVTILVGKKTPVEFCLGSNVILPGL